MVQRPQAVWASQNEDLVIPYPSEAAHGVGPSATAIDGDFYGVGVTVAHRCCNGSCCYETFSFPQSMKLQPHDEPDEHGPTSTSSRRLPAIRYCRHRRSSY